MKNYDEYISSVKNFKQAVDFDEMLMNIYNRSAILKKTQRIRFIMAAAAIMLVISMGSFFRFSNSYAPNQDILSYVFENNSANNSITDYIFSE